MMMECVHAYTLLVPVIIVASGVYKSVAAAKAVDVHRTVPYLLVFLFLLNFLFNSVL